MSHRTYLENINNSNTGSGGGVIDSPVTLHTVTIQHTGRYRIFGGTNYNYELDTNGYKVDLQLTVDGVVAILVSSGTLIEESWQSVDDSIFINTVLDLQRGDILRLVLDPLGGEVIRIRDADLFFFLERCN